MQTRNSSVFGALCRCLVLTAFTLVTSVRGDHGDTHEWFGSGHFSEPTNWIPLGVPGTADAALFDDIFTTAFLFPDEEIVIDSLFIRDSRVTFEASEVFRMASMSLVSESEAALEVSGLQDCVGCGESLELQIHLQIESGGAVIGNGEGDFAEVFIPFSNGSLKLPDGALVVGTNGGRGQFTASGEVESALGVIGDNGGRGSVTIESLRGWTVERGLTVGADGTGSLVIDDNGKVQSGAAFIGNGQDGVGTVTVTGSDFFGELRSGLWESGAGGFVLGGAGQGSLEILNAGKVNSTSPILGFAPGSTGTALVSGDDSAWVSEGVFNIGGVALPPDTESFGGTGSLTVERGGVVITSATHPMYIGGGGVGSLAIQSSGEVQTGWIGSISGSAQGKGDVTVSGGGRWEAEFLWVGNRGEGTLSVLNGGKVEARTLTGIGVDAGGQGSATVAGFGSELVTPTLNIASSSESVGELNVGNFGTVLVTQGIVQIGPNGNLNLVGGTVRTDGFENTFGGLNLTDGLLSVEGSEGFTHYGNALIIDGAAAEDLPILSLQRNVVGNVFVSEASPVPAVLTVGNEHQARIELAENSELTAATNVFGNLAGSDGSILIYGGNFDAHSMSIGLFGTGSLEVVTGGEATTPKACLGCEASGNGSANISGTGSAWVVNQMLDVGGQTPEGRPGRQGGTGLLTVDDHAVVSTCDLVIWPGGTVVEQNGGRIETCFALVKGGALEISSTTAFDSVLSLSEGPLTIESNGTLRLLGSEGTNLIEGNVLNQGSAHLVGSATVTGQWINERNAETIVNPGEPDHELTVNGSFNNSGTVTLTSEQGQDVVFSLGPEHAFTNLAGGIINIDTGGGGTRLLDARLVNDGNLNLNAPLEMTHSLTINTGQLNLAGDSFLSVPGFTQSGGILLGAGNVVVNGPLAWTGGQMAGAGTTEVNGPITLSGPDTKTLNGRTLINNDIAHWTEGDIRGSVTTVITNSADATFNITGGGSFLSSFSSGAEFNNDGIINYGTDIGNAFAEIEAAVNNTGLVNIESGTMQIKLGGTSSGQFTVQTDGVLDFYRITSTLLPESSLSGAGTVRFSGAGHSAEINGTYDVGHTEVTNGRVEFQSDATTHSASLTDSFGQLGGSGTVTVTDAFTWTAGIMTGTGTTIVEGALDVSGPDNKFVVNGRTLVNQGVATWSGNGEITVGSGSAFTNAEGATLHINNNARMLGSFSEFNNEGIVNKGTETGNALTEIQTAFNNSGSVAVNAGTLLLAGGGTSSGQFAVAAGATLDFGRLNDEFSESASITAAGTVRFSGNGSTKNFAGSYDAARTEIDGGRVNFQQDVSTDDLTLGGGTGSLSGPSTMTVANSFTWTAGLMSGGGTTIVQGPTENLRLAQKLDRAYACA